MVPENIAITRSVAAAAYLILEPEDYEKVFPENTGHKFHKKEDAHHLLKNSASLSKKQRIAVFAYLYLYTRLQNKDVSVLQPVRHALAISKGILMNLELNISTRHIDYIHSLYQRRNRSFVEMFIEPDDFIMQIIEDVVLTEVPEEKKKLGGLKTSEYEHEAEKAGLEELKSQKTLSEVVKLFNDYAFERMEIVRLTGSGFLVTETNLPFVYGSLQEVCKVLNIHKMPQLYLTNGGIGAHTIGTKNPIICLNSGCLSLLTYDELLFVLGHEAGHIKSDHFLYHSMAQHLGSIANLAGTFTLGLSSLVTMPLQLALLAWYRNSELTADRAGLLACQNPDAAYSLFTKLSGYPLKYYHSINTKDILNQARAFEDLDRESYNKFAKTYSIMDSSHPWTIMRAKELDKWVASGRYTGLLNQKAIIGSTYADCGGEASLVTVSVKSDSLGTNSREGSACIRSNPIQNTLVADANVALKPGTSDAHAGKDSSRIGINIKSHNTSPDNNKDKPGITVQVKK